MQSHQKYFSNVFFTKISYPSPFSFSIFREIGITGNGRLRSRKQPFYKIQCTTNIFRLLEKRPQGMVYFKLTL